MKVACSFQLIKVLYSCRSGGAVASWLVLLTPERAVRVRALAGDIVLCSWARHFTLTVPLSTQVYKWAVGNLMLGVSLQWTCILSRWEQKCSQSLHATVPSLRPRPGVPLGLGLVYHLASAWCATWLECRLH